MEFTISTALWVLEVRCCLYGHRFYPIDHRHDMVDGCRSKMMNVVSGVRQVSVICPIIVPRVHLGAFYQSGL